MTSILLAEDEAVLRMLITDTLEDNGYEIDIACDGQEAIEKIERKAYRLIILDYMMPRLTGLEVIPLVRAMPDRRDAKILMLSAKNQKSEQERVMEAGADAFMSKPFSPMALAQKVVELLDA